VSGDFADEQTGAVVDGLMGAIRAVGSYGEEHPTVSRAAEQLRADIGRAHPPLVLQFVADCAFREQRLVPMTIERYKRTEQLNMAFRNLGCHELSIEPQVPVASLVALAGALARALQGPSDELERRKLPGLSWRAIPNMAWGEDAELVDPEVFCATQSVLALLDLEMLSVAGELAWPWRRALSVVRRVERAVERSPAATGHALETAPGEWSPARRALSAAAMVARALKQLEVTPAAARVLVHAAVGLGVCGFMPRGASSWSFAGRGFLERLMAMKVRMRRGVETHRLRLFAVAQAVSDGDDASLAPARLLRAAWELEAERWPDGVQQPLALVDLLARRRRAWAGSELEPSLRVLLATTGLVPPGTRVRLADGTEGVAMGPGPSGDPWRPLVLAEGWVREAAEPVTLAGPG
jgi:hypothetical protein